MTRIILAISCTQATVQRFICLNWMGILYTQCFPYLLLFDEQSYFSMLFLLNFPGLENLFSTFVQRRSEAKLRSLPIILDILLIQCGTKLAWEINKGITTAVNNNIFGVYLLTAMKTICGKMVITSLDWILKQSQHIKILWSAFSDGILHGSRQICYGLLH